MASIGLSEAAKLTGRNQSTIHRAMKAGRLSYTVGEAGERRIDTAELDRVFRVKLNGVNGGASLDALAKSRSVSRAKDAMRAVSRRSDGGVATAPGADVRSDRAGRRRRRCFSSCAK